MDSLTPATLPNRLRILLAAISSVRRPTSPFRSPREARRTRLPYARAATAGLIVLLVAAGCAEQPPTAATEQTRSATGGEVAATAVAGTATPMLTLAPTQDPALGDRVQVDSLDLTVLGIERIDTTQFNSYNEASLRVFVLATNARGAEGAEYNLWPLLDFRLVDSNGVVHDATLLCAGCPSEIGDTYLPPGRSVLGYVYFEFPPDRDPVELIYEPLLSLNSNSARIDLTQTGNEAGTRPPELTPERLSGQPQVGDAVRVGSLDLTVLEHGPFATNNDNPFNSDNYAVRILAVNARGDADAFLEILRFELIDAHGIHRNASRLACVDCSAATVDDDISEILLVRGRRVEILVSFGVPDDVHGVELRYAQLESTNAARIWLR